MRSAWASAGGTTQIQRKILAEQVLGLPREPAVAMDFEVSDDQVALQEGIGQFCAGRLPPAAARRFGEPGGFDQAAWAELAELGTFGINLPEESGGVGLAAIDAVLVYEVLGAGLVPGPVVAATLAAAVLPDADAAAVLAGTLVPAVIDLPSETDHARRAAARRSPARCRRAPRDRRRRRTHVVDPATTKAARVEEALDPTASGRAPSIICPRAT